MQSHLRFRLVLASLLAATVNCNDADSGTDRADLSSTILIPGTTPGSATVSPTGAASYAIPVAIAPGIAGSQPALSIQYSSHGTSGILGQGFSLAGLSAIAPCPRTVADDGVATDVAFDASDRLCLDGQRLVSVNGLYNQTGAEYRTARESLARIRQRADGFVVDAKSGPTLEYGVTRDSRIDVSSGAGVRVWALSRTTDRTGNVVRYAYAADTANGDYFPTSIEYAANAAAGVVANQKVEFRYKTRSDVTPAFVGGAAVKTTRLLQSIAAFESGVEFRSMNFDYDAGHRGRARLISVQECGAERNGPNQGKVVCLRPTRFEWTSAAPLTSVALESAPNVAGLLSSAITGDFNGDGIVDLVQVQSATAIVNVGAADDSRFRGWANWGSGFYGAMLAGDFNGDGKSDLLDVRGDGTAYAWLSFGNGFNATLFASGLADASRLRVADFDADGRSDLFEVAPNGDLRVFVSRGASPASPVMASLGLELENVRLADFDGDGRADILHVQGGTFRVIRWGAAGPSSSAWGADGSATGQNVRIGDVNGDGKGDLIVITAGGAANVHLSTGRGFVAQGTWSTGHNQTTQIADLDADGKGDLFQYDGGGTELQVALSNGIGAFGALTKITERSLAPARYPSTRVDTRSFNPWGHYVHTNDDFRDGVWRFCSERGLGTTVAGASVRKQRLSSWCERRDTGHCRVFASGEREDCSLSNRCPGSTEGAIDAPGTLSVRPLDAPELSSPTIVSGDYEAVATRHNGNWFVHTTDIDPGGNVVEWVDCQTVDTSEQEAVDRFSVQLGDLDGDGDVDLLQRGNGGLLRLARNPVNAHYDVLRAVTNGQGARTEVDYAPLMTGGVYTPLDEPMAYPLTAATGASYVVKETRETDGAGSVTRNLYQYQGARTRVDGRGFLGFRRVVTRNLATGIETLQALRTDEPFAGQVEYSERRWLAPDGRTLVLGKSWNELAMHPGYPKLGVGGRIDFVVQTGAIEKSWDLDGAPLPDVSTRNEGYQYGNPTKVVTSTSFGADTLKKTTLALFDHDEASWTLSRIRKSTTTTEWTGAAALTRTTTSSYLPNGLLAAETVEPGNAELEVTTRYEYDGLGHVVAKRASGADGTAPRTIATEFADPRFPTTTSNELGHQVRAEYDARFGLATRTIDNNGLATETDYDAFGRKRRTKAPSGVESTSELYFCDATCPAGASVWGQVKTLGGATQRSYLDVLGREIASDVEGWNARWVRVQRRYNSQGLVVAESRPAFLGDPVYWSQATYDALGRVTSTTAPDGGTTRSTYAGLSSATTDALGRTSRSTKNAAGWLAQSVDAQGNAVTFTHDADGHVVSTVDPNKQRHTWSYDLRGRLTREVSPDRGAVAFTYNAFGELVSERWEATGAETRVVVDALGRVVRRTAPEGTTVYRYDTGLGAIGKLTSEEFTPDGDGVVANTRSYAYDARARLVGVEHVIDGETFHTTSTYDALSRLVSVTEPSGLALSYSYDAQGHHVSIANATSGLEYWRAIDTAADGQVRVERLGNGRSTTRDLDPKTGRVTAIRTPNREGSVACVPAVCTMDMATYDAQTKSDAAGCTFSEDNGRSERLPQGCASVTVQSYLASYDLVGNLTSRRDLVTGLDEAFEYDALSRLKSAKLAANGTALEKANAGKTVTYAYDAVGRLTARSDVGQYAYEGPKPHAVTRTTGPVAAEFTYDVSGNLLSGHGRTLTWTSFQKPLRIERGEAFSEFAYGLGHARVRQALPHGRQITYVSGSYEERATNGDVDRVHRISAGHGLVAEITVKGQSESVVYFGTDHLGSITVVTNQDGEVVQRLGYDAHGKRRFASGGDDTAGTLKSAATTRGFTGHEMLDDLGLVHMNARVYDPTFGVFLSPDSVTQFPSSTQGWNRYSYVGQNPLSFTDPTGHMRWGSVFRIVVAVVAVVAVVVTGGAALAAMGAMLSGLTGGFISAAVATAAVTAAATTFVFTAIVTGSLRVAAKAALIAGVCAGVGAAAGGGYLGGALEGTGRAAWQGGDLKQGFITGAAPLASLIYAYKDRGTDGIAMALGQKAIAMIAERGLSGAPGGDSAQQAPRSAPMQLAGLDSGTMSDVADGFGNVEQRAVSPGGLDFGNHCRPMEPGLERNYFLEEMLLGGKLFKLAADGVRAAVGFAREFSVRAWTLSEWAGEAAGTTGGYTVYRGGRELGRFDAHAFEVRGLSLDVPHVHGFGVFGEKGHFPWRAVVDAARGPAAGGHGLGVHSPGSMWVPKYPAP